MPIVRATATFTPRGDVGQFIAAKITPGAIAGTKAAADAVLEQAQSNVHVISGDLRDSGVVVQREVEKTVVYEVAFTEEYAAYEEFGTGTVGASSAGAGKGPYSMTWKGREAHPYLRPALDSTREKVRKEIASAISLQLR